MNTLFVSATRAEIAPSIDLLEKMGFDTLITGVGMVATAYHLGRTLEGKDYALLVNVGVAGSFSPVFPLGTVVNVVKDQFIELGAEDHESFIPIEQLGFGSSMVKATSLIASPTLEKLAPVQGITVNRVHGRAESIRSIRNVLPEHTIESMEGASVFFAAEQSGIPAIQVRAISNYVEPRDRSRWKMELAIQNLNHWILEFAEEIAPLCKR